MSYLLRVASKIEVNECMISVALSTGQPGLSLRAHLSPLKLARAVQALIHLHEPLLMCTAVLDRCAELSAILEVVLFVEGRRPVGLRGGPRVQKTQPAMLP